MMALLDSSFRVNRNTVVLVLIVMLAESHGIGVRSIRITRSECLLGQYILILLDFRGDDVDGFPTTTGVRGLTKLRVEGVRLVGHIQTELAQVILLVGTHNGYT